MCNTLMGGNDRCLCGLIHIKMGTWVIAIVHIVLAILMVINAVLTFVDIADSQYSNRTK